MKKNLALVLLLSAFAAGAQKTDLSTVNTVKPKAGQKMAFEAAYKVHVAKFHKADEKIEVWEIISGDWSGYYHLVNEGMSYADLDGERADAAAHAADLDKTFFPLLEDTRNGIYRMVDSLSLRPATVADKCVVNVRHLKTALLMNDYKRELARNIKIYSMLQGGIWPSLSYKHFDKLWNGSDRVVVNIRQLKDGFKSLEQGFYPAAPAGSPSFRDEYTKLYGNTAWDDRVKALDNIEERAEAYIMKRRKDLSSQ